MTLFALGESWRPWHETDAYIVAIVLTLLLLLAIFNRFRSFLANGVLIGCVLGCLCVICSSEQLYIEKMSYVEWGILFGLLFGGLAKLVFMFFQNPPLDKGQQALQQGCDGSGTLVIRITALGISGISVGLTLAVLFKMTYVEGVIWMAGLCSLGFLLGATAGPLSKRISWLSAAIELWIFFALSSGIGAIIGWKFVLPILMFDVNPDVTTEVLARVATCSGAGAGFLIGLIVWTAIIVRRKGKDSSPTAST